MKSLTELKQELDERKIDRRKFSDDFYLAPAFVSDGEDGKKMGYKKHHARRISFVNQSASPDQAESTVGLRGPGVGENESDPEQSRINKQIKQPSRTIKSNTNKLPYVYPFKMGKPKVNNEEVVLDESSNEDPPYVLVLKRENIRLFPNNVKVALYFSDKINKYFSVAYGKGINASIQSESTEEQSFVANILNTFINLSEENQIKMLEMATKDLDSYNKLKNFIKEQSEK